MTFKILTEASGSLVASGFMRALKQAGFHVVATDSSESISAQNIADTFIQVPPANSPEWQSTIQKILKSEKIDFVFPTLDDGLLKWVQIAALQNQTKIITSPSDTLKVCLDKWLTYQFFTEHKIPTPATSKMPQYDLIKPRLGRGSKGIYRQSQNPNQLFNENLFISQQPVLGIEYTIDLVCDINNKPASIVTRRRDKIIDGKSINSTIVSHPKIEDYCKKICATLPFFGPINFQAIESDDHQLYFIEMNPRLAGGAALSIQATQNWIPNFIEHVIHTKELIIQLPKIGLRMERSYEDYFA